MTSTHVKSQLGTAEREKSGRGEERKGREGEEKGGKEGEGKHSISLNPALSYPYPSLQVFFPPGVLNRGSQNTLNSLKSDVKFYTYVSPWKEVPQVPSDF